MYGKVTMELFLDDYNRVLMEHFDSVEELRSFLIRVIKNGGTYE